MVNWNQIKQELDGAVNGTVLLVQNDEVLLQGAYGEASIDPHRPMELSTRFNLASVSKPLTALGILLLVQEERLSLADHVNQWLPELPYEHVSVHHLLTHTAGLPDYMEYFASCSVDTVVTNEEILEVLVKYRPKPLFEPGERMEYSNTGYVLLALLIERITKQSFADYMDEAMFKPLQMTHTTVTSPTFTTQYAEEIAQGYVYDVYEGEYKLPAQFAETKSTVCLNYITGDGGIYSTVGDLYRLGKAVLDGQWIETSLLEKAFTPSSQTKDTPMPYGLGFILSEDPELGKCVWHNGGWPGYATTFKLYPKTKTIFIFLRNKEQNLEYELALGTAIENALTKGEWQPPTKPRQLKAVVLPEETIEQYVGEYELIEHPEYQIQIALQDQHLYIYLPKSMPLELHAKREDEFFLRGLDVFITIKGKKLTIHDDQTKSIAIKKEC